MRPNHIHLMLADDDLDDCMFFEEVLKELPFDFAPQQKDAVVKASGLCEVQIIPLQFRQLLQNLFSNAIKFSSLERQLKIKITADTVDSETLNADKLPAGAKYCHIRFSDNGIGFDQRFGEKIFEVFQRLLGL
jgi:signal transduction histidine kinase